MKVDLKTIALIAGVSIAAVVAAKKSGLLKDYL